MDQDTVRETRSMIHKLPPELLCLIFLILRADEIRAEDDDLETWSWGEGSNMWFRVAGVCSGWRHVVNTLPQIFQYVHIKRRREWAQLCFERSKGPSGSLPVTVTIHFPSMLPSVLDLLSANGPHIRRLALRYCIDETIRHLHYLGPHMTALTDLSISVHDHEYRSSYTGAEIAASLFPALNSMYLAYAPVVDWNASVFRRLRRLHLEKYRDSMSRRNVTITFDTFLRQLRGCQALEELTLDLYDWPFNPYSGAPGNDRNLSSEVTLCLPRIRIAQFLCPCSLEPDSPEIFHVLSHFRFMATTDVYVYSQVYDEDHCGRGGLLRTIPQDANALQILTRATSGRVCTGSTGVFLDGCCGKGSLTVDLEDMHQPEGEEWGYSPNLLLADFCTLFARSPLQELAVGIHFEGAAWRQLLQTFPGLRSLSLDGKSVTDKVLLHRLQAVLRALSIVSQSREKDELLVPVPGLRSLTLKNVALDEDAFRTLGSCLVARSEYQSTLQVLKLRLYVQDPPHPTNVEMVSEIGLTNEALVAEPLILEELRREDHGIEYYS